MRGATDFMADIAVMIRKQVVDAVPTFRWATVTGANPLRIRFDGETDPLPITPDALVNPPVGARVFVLHWMRRVTVLGRAGHTRHRMGAFRPVACLPGARRTAADVSGARWCPLHAWCGVAEKR